MRIVTSTMLFITTSTSIRGPAVRAAAIGVRRPIAAIAINSSQLER